MTWLPQPERGGVGEPRPTWLGNGSPFEMGIASQEVGGAEVQVGSSGRYTLANTWEKRGTI